VGAFLFDRPSTFPRLPARGEIDKKIKKRERGDRVDEGGGKGNRGRRLPSGAKTIESSVGPLFNPIQSGMVSGMVSFLILGLGTIT